MAYVCDVDQVVQAQSSARRPEGLMEALGALPRRTLDWLSAWNDAADEAAAARRVFSPCGGKITDGLEREMMQRMLQRDWVG